MQNPIPFRSPSDVSNHDISPAAPNGASAPVQQWRPEQAAAVTAPPAPWWERSIPRGVLAAVPVVLVNAVAFAGQLAFLRDHLHWHLPGQILVAVALESVAIYLAYHAHLAQLANDSAARLRIAAYTFALGIGTMNYSHYMAPHWRPTFLALVCGLMSAASPWLWSIHSRRTSRDSLMARGLVEEHAVRLGSTRWAWHPIRSAKVMFHATWEGITSPTDALAAARVADMPPVDLDSDLLETLPARDRMLIAFGAVGSADVPKALALLAERGAGVDQSHGYQVRKAIVDGRSANGAGA
jgi:hypothetical protein